MQRKFYAYTTGCCMPTVMKHAHRPQSHKSSVALEMYTHVRSYNFTVVWTWCTDKRTCEWMYMLIGREAAAGSSLRWFNGRWCSQDVEVRWYFHVPCYKGIA